jgi:UDPglucose 6-dehydrogenase
MMDLFRRRLRPKTIAVIGSGVVGTATGRGFTAAGHRVVFCDADPGRVERLRSEGWLAMRCAELPMEEFLVDAYLISVPSPTVLGRVDLSYVRDASSTVGHALKRQRGWPVVVVRSTVPPGTTDEVVIPVIEEVSGQSAGRDFGVCVNPEFLRARTADADFLDPRVIVIGALDIRSDRSLRRLYTSWTDAPVITTSLRTAEATKYVANLFNATKISFFNEMHGVLTKLGADPDVAARAVALGAEGMWNPAYGTRGGAPFAGACLPKDTLAFLGVLEQEGLASLAPILRAVVEVNDKVARTARPLDEDMAPAQLSPDLVVMPEERGASVRT